SPKRPKLGFMMLFLPKLHFADSAWHGNQQVDIVRTPGRSFSAMVEAMYQFLIVCFSCGIGLFMGIPIRAAGSGVDMDRVPTLMRKARDCETSVRIAAITKIGKLG